MLATTVLGVLSGLASADVLIAPPARAQEQVAVRSFNIPAQPLASAISAFGRQSGLQVTIAAGVASGLRSSPVSGTLSPDQALARLLAGTGLPYRINGDGTAIIGTAQGADAGIDADGSTVLDTITVVGRLDAANGSGFQGTPDWVYETPASVSVVSREAIEGSGARDTRDLLNSVAGAYSGEGQGSFPTVSPNIRGLQDSGRVAVSIDGARQHAEDGGRYGSSGLANFGGAFVDSAFIREVDVNKNAGAGSGNAGVLGGTVNFRTVGAQDLIPDGQNWGVEMNAGRGTNAFNFQGSVLGAVRLEDTLALTAGFSGLNLGQYEPGTHGDGGGIYNLTGRDAWSSLLKLEGDFDEVSTSLSWMHQENDFAYRPADGSEFLNHFDTRNDSVVADLGWNPENPLIDFKAKFWLNDTAVHETRDARGRAPETYIDKGLTSFGVALENTSELETKAGRVTLNYGVEAFRDDATKSATSASIAENPLYASSYGSFNPPGRRDVASLFLNGKWEPTDWVNIQPGLRYDWYRMKGEATYYSRETVERRLDCVTFSFEQYQQWVISNGFASSVSDFTDAEWQDFYQWEVLDVSDANGCLNAVGLAGFGLSEVTYETIYPDHTLDIDNSGGAWLPSVTVELTPTEWFRPYVSYGQSFRPPTITEAFIAGGLAPADAVGMSLAPNPHLRPETARTWEIGANMYVDDLLREGDRLRVKAAAFHRRIRDYIVMGTIVTDDVLDTTYTSFVNADGPTTMRGVELEGNYDTGRFWLGGSATWLDTEWPEKTEVFSNVTITTDGSIFAVSGNVPPRFKVTIDGGARFFEEKLSVGARVNHVTPTLSRTVDEEGNLTEVTEPYTTLDLYGTYRFTDHATLRFAVNNVTDVNYVPATGNYKAPGRTFLATLKMRF